MQTEEHTYKERKHFIPLDSVDSLVLERDPTFVDYLFFHNVLDKFCWTLKLQYADRDTVKRKRYRLDTLFQRFLLANEVAADRARPCLAPSPNKERLEFHLTKGWHNELIRNDPLHPDYLRVGTQLSGWSGPGSGGTAAWNVIQSYYAVFEFLSCLVVAVKPDLKILGHKQLARELNNHVLGPTRDRLVLYPFSLSSRTERHLAPPRPPHCQHHYATYPREPGRSIDELEGEVRKAFALINDGKPASILDLLYQLRLWANYTGVQSLLRLSDGGYQGFLMKNLGTIVFFVAGLVELATLFALGKAKYLGMLKTFGTAYIDRNERFDRHKYLVPSYVRLRAYKHLGLISGSIDFIIPSNLDPVQFIDMRQGSPAGGTAALGGRR